MKKLAYSFHLGNDKNKTKKARQLAKESKTGATSFSNNSIQNAKQLSKANNHNLRKYDNELELIKTIYGSNDLVNDVKNLYQKEFEQARIVYNNKQIRSDRKIDNYFNHISNNDKTDLACEIIIELGDMEYWQDKDDNYKSKMIDVYKEQVNDLVKVVPNFRIGNATIHFDESSPHLHIVGIPVKEGNKNGMAKQVGKSSIFTKESLVKIQDEMRDYCINSFNRIYDTDKSLKTKDKGRNKDIKSSEMEGYKQEEKELVNQIKILEKEKISNNKLIKEQAQIKSQIEDEIENKKKYNHKIILKDKASLLKENEELKKELSSIKWDYKELKENYDTLKSKVDYVLEAIKKIITKIPDIIVEMIETLFDKNQSIWNHEHNQLVKEKQRELEEYKKNNPIYNIYDKKVDKPKERDKEKDDFEL